jgi:hypothetical protein
MNQGILSKIYLDLVTDTSLRNVQSLTQSFDLSAEMFIHNDNFQLNPSSNTILSGIAAFIHLQFSGFATLILTQSSSNLTLSVNKLFYVVAPFTSIEITNQDTINVLLVKAIYA